MAVKITLIAEIDGDKFVEALKIPALSAAVVTLAIEIKYRSHKISCETPDDALAVINELSGRNRLSAPDTTAPRILGEFFSCEFCGCRTNAKQRACCDVGREADRKRVADKYAASEPAA
jgi:hypothetical protein